MTYLLAFFFWDKSEQFMSWVEVISLRSINKGTLQIEYKFLLWYNPLYLYNNENVPCKQGQNSKFK